jgi:hypothetical protein
MTIYTDQIWTLYTTTVVELNKNEPKSHGFTDNNNNNSMQLTS